MPITDSTERWWQSILCPKVSANRLGAVRALIGGFTLIYLLARFPAFWRLSHFNQGQFRPLGIVRLLEQPLSSLQWHALLIITLALAFTFAFGFKHKILAPIFAFALLFTISYRNCWGMIFHTENLMVLHIGILALFPAANAWSISKGPDTSSTSRTYGWALFLMSLVTIIAYTLAGYAKLRFGGWSWASGDVLRNYVAMDNLRKLLLGDTYSPLAGPAMKLGFAFTLMASASLFLELSAPLALFSKRFARLWAPAMIAFHLGIVFLMAIVFPYPLCGLAFASFYPAEKVMQWLADKKWIQRIAAPLYS